MRLSVQISMIILFLLFLLTNHISAQNKLFEKRQYINPDNDTLRYQFLKNQKGNEKVPLIIYLCGGGDSGRDNVKQLDHAPKIITDSIFRSNYSFCFIAPQIPPVGRGWVDARWRKTRYKMQDKPSIPLGLLIENLDSIIARNNIDRKRIYVTGISNGGIGTWDLICRYPLKFAAAMPLCGIGDNRQAKNIIHVPVWVFHGARDERIDVRYARTMVKALQEVGGNPKYTEYPDLPHSIWDETYSNMEVWKWLFSQKLK